MNFIEALQAIQDKQMVTRKKWGGKATVYIVNNKLNNITHVEVRTMSNCIMYAASSEDLLAMDWKIVDKNASVDKKRQLRQDEIEL